MPNAMLFLLNDKVLEIGRELDLMAAEIAAGARRASVGGAVELGQRVLFTAESFALAHAAMPALIAASIAVGSEANAALFIRPAGAKDHKGVAVRLASIPLTTLARLEQLQRERPLTPSEINAHVWSLAGAAGAA